MKQRKLLFLVAILFLYGSFVSVTHATPVAIEVTTTAVGMVDDGACSFREAISNANNNDQYSNTLGECASGNSGLDTIVFNIPGVGPHVIAESSLSVNIGEPVIIDGTTQPGSSCGIRPDMDDGSNPRTLMIEFDGSGYVQPAPDQTPPFFSLDPGSGGTTIKGIAIYGNPVAQNMRIDTSDNVVICSNIGTEGTGLIAKGGKAGIDLFTGINKSDNRIGGTDPGDFNIISGNEGTGLTVDGGSDSTLVVGNLFGIDATGIQQLPNINTGGGSVTVNEAENTIIGGTTLAERNYFGGSMPDSFGTLGIFGGSGNQVIGNVFGIGTDGVTSVMTPDQMPIAAITIVATTGLVIGGDTESHGNIIANHPIAGIMSLSTTSGIVKNNTISNISNTAFGVSYGVYILSVETLLPGDATIAILRNSISGMGQGIELAQSDTFGEPDTEYINRGPDENDSGDGDTGPNGYLNHPVIHSVDSESGAVDYTLDVPGSEGTPRYYRIEFFRNDEGVYGQGKTYVEDDFVTSVGVPVRQTKDVDFEANTTLTATATECTDVTCTAFLATSEFSNAYEPIVVTIPVSGGIVPVSILAAMNPTAPTTPSVGSPTGGVVDCNDTYAYSPSTGKKCPVSETTKYLFTRNLRFGMSGDDVLKLQQFLNTHGAVIATIGPGSIGNETRMFGLKTMQALVAYQKMNRITPASGYFGPVTRAFINLQ